MKMECVVNGALGIIHWFIKVERIVVVVVVRRIRLLQVEECLMRVNRLHLVYRILCFEERVRYNDTNALCHIKLTRWKLGVRLSLFTCRKVFVPPFLFLFTAK